MNNYFILWTSDSIRLRHSAWLNWKFSTFWLGGPRLDSPSRLNIKHSGSWHSATTPAPCPKPSAPAFTFAKNQGVTSLFSGNTAFFVNKSICESNQKCFDPRPLLLGRTCKLCPSPLYWSFSWTIHSMFIQTQELFTTQYLTFMSAHTSLIFNYLLPYFGCYCLKSCLKAGLSWLKRLIFWMLWEEESQINLISWHWP